jgi:hypothetical protein
MVNKCYGIEVLDGHVVALDLSANGKFRSVPFSFITPSFQGLHGKIPDTLGDCPFIR